MINAHAFYVPACDAPLGRDMYSLSKSIAAIQVLPGDGVEQPRLGMITQLPSGAELQPCGEGFNERTVRVKWGEGYYFVFLQDLDIAKACAAAS